MLISERDLKRNLTSSLSRTTVLTTNTFRMLTKSELVLTALQEIDIQTHSSSANLPVEISNISTLMVMHASLTLVTSMKSWEVMVNAQLVNKPTCQLKQLQLSHRLLFKMPKSHQNGAVNSKVTCSQLRRPLMGYQIPWPTLKSERDIGGQLNSLMEPKRYLR